MAVAGHLWQESRINGYGEEAGQTERRDGEGGKGQEGTMFNDIPV